MKGQEALCGCCSHPNNPSQLTILHPTASVDGLLMLILYRSSALRLSPLLLLLALFALISVPVAANGLPSPPSDPVVVLIEQPSDSSTTSLLTASVSAAAMVSWVAATARVMPLLRLSRVTHSSVTSASVVRVSPCFSVHQPASSISSAVSPSPPSSAPDSSPAPTRLPSVFISHGGGPSFFMPSSSSSDRFSDIGPDSAAFRALQSLPSQLHLTGSRRPRALLVISGHWESDDGAVHITARSTYPSLMYDYYGFPPHTYQLKYPAPGDEKLSQRVHSLLSGSGIAARLDSERLFDHGVFVPLLVAFPQADIPVVQISLLSSLDAAAHLNIGRALAPLRDEGVLIIGSGFITHNFNPTVSPRPFMARLTQLLTAAPPAEREQALRQWQLIEGATDAHKRADHFMPLFVAVGAASDEQGVELAKLFVMGGMWCFANYKVAQHAQTHAVVHDLYNATLCMYGLHRGSAGWATPLTTRVYAVLCCVLSGSLGNEPQPRSSVTTQQRDVLAAGHTAAVFITMAV